MNKTRGLFRNRNVLNTNQNSVLTTKRGLNMNLERSLKDLHKTKIHNNIKHELINEHSTGKIKESKWTDQRDNNDTDASQDQRSKPKVAVLSNIETAISSTEVPELNLVNNAPTPVVELKIPNDDDDIDYPDDNDSHLPDSEKEHSIVESYQRNEYDIDEDELELDKKKEENYKKFINEYNIMIKYLNSEIYKEYELKLEDKLKNIKNDNELHNYTVDDMMYIIKKTLIEYLEHDKKALSKKIQSIENRDENKNKKKEQIKSLTYKKHIDKLKTIENDINIVNEYSYDN